MDNQESFARRLSEGLKSARKSQGLTLDALARRSGVSRSMLSQIERGESSPTVATLWSLTRALDVDFAGLWRDGAENAESGLLEITRAARAPRIDGQGEGCRLTILSPPSQVGDLEIYDLKLEAQGALKSEPHRAGAEEQLLVLDGAVTVRSGAGEARLEAGDAARYRADRIHAIEAPDAPAHAILLVRNA